MSGTASRTAFMEPNSRLGGGESAGQLPIVTTCGPLAKRPTIAGARRPERMAERRGVGREVANADRLSTRCPACEKHGVKKIGTTRGTGYLLTPGMRRTR